jgi:YVTN family beta-propeller protein
MNTLSRVIVILGSMAAAAGAATSFAQSTPQYRVTRTVALGAPERWDYVLFDSSSGRVYVAHGPEVAVVDGTSGAIIGKVTGFPGGTHGVAIVTRVGRGYTDDGKAGEAASFDLKTLSVKQHIKAAEDADAVAFDESSGHVFVINGDTGTVTVIDPKSDAAIASVSVGEKLEFAVSGKNGKVYVNGAGNKDLIRIDSRTNQVDARWPIPECTSPHGLAIDTATHRLFSSCVNNVLMVVDSDSGAVVAKLPIGSGTDAAAFDPKRKLVFSSNGRDGTLSIIQERDANTFVSLGDMKTLVSARTMSLNPETGRLYLVAADVESGAHGKPPATSGSGRPSFVPGSLRLLFLDPAP